MLPSSKPQAVFVYGTLKRGQCRENCWPYKPLEVVPATVQGRLYDLGPYPALIVGDDRILGELWRFRSEHMAGTLSVLDRVEGHDLGDTSLYIRDVIVCEDQAGNRWPAYTYFYAETIDLPADSRVGPNASGLCVWG